MKTLAYLPSVTRPESNATKVSLRTLVELEQHRQRRRRMVLAVVLLAIPVGAFAIWYGVRPRPVPLAARFRMQAVSRGDVLREVQASGHLEAQATVNVGAEVSGRMLAVLADYNDQVHVGQVLARFDAASVDAQVAQIGAAIAQARAALAQAESDRDQARENLERAERLFAGQAVPALDRDTAMFTLRSADARVRAAKAQLASQQAAYTLARTNRSHTEIKSPIDGIVITRNIDPGQTVISALQSPVLFVIAADLKHMRVIAAVDEADIGDVRAGQTATFTVNAYPQRTFSGAVVEVRNAPVVVENVVTYGTVIEVDNESLSLRPGMTASVRIRTGTALGVLRIPNAALHFVPPAEASGPGRAGKIGHGVWKISGGALERVSVTTGITDSQWTEIHAGSVSLGDRLITELTREGRQSYGIAR